jgi:hypothetical protein
MPSDPRPARTYLRPAADFSKRTIPFTRQPQRSWYRLHRAGSPALSFARLPHHRFSHPNCPFPFLYVGAIKYASRFLDQPCLALFDR